MSVVEKVDVDIAVVLGNAIMPVHQILRMGRGAVIELDSYEEDDLVIMANKKPIARGQVLIQGDKIAIKITEFIKKPLVEKLERPIETAQDETV
jgi:flagellar motor switch protein FliN/FliY